MAKTFEELDFDNISVGDFEGPANEVLKEQPPSPERLDTLSRVTFDRYSQADYLGEQIRWWELYLSAEAAIGQLIMARQQG